MGREAYSSNSSIGDAEARGLPLAPVQYELPRKVLSHYTSDKHKNHIKAFPQGLCCTEEDADSSDQLRHTHCYDQ